MLAFNPELEVEENHKMMVEALSKVKTGQVTYAVRNTTIDDKEVLEGDILGIRDGQINVIGKDVNSVCQQLLESLVDEESSIISIFYGHDIDEQTAEQLSEFIENSFPDCDVEIHNGDQPLYYYIIAVE
jgi:hypothetical protein